MIYSMMVGMVGMVGMVSMMDDGYDLFSNDM